MYYVGTYGNVTAYEMNGQKLLRRKSSLTGKRVKKSPAFKKTMEFARQLGQASKIASEFYQTVPPQMKSLELFRVITGQVIRFLKEGATEQETRDEVSVKLPWIIKDVVKELGKRIR